MISGLLGPVVNLAYYAAGKLKLSISYAFVVLNLDWAVGLVVRDPECQARGRGVHSHPGQIFV